MTEVPPHAGSADDVELAMDVETALATRTGLPTSATWVRELFADQPWNEHPNYDGLAAFWQQVHRGIKRDAADLRSLLERFRDNDHDPQIFQSAFSGRLQQYLGHLQFHHQIEDDSYFPKFRRLDPRLVAGFDLLEADHEIIHERLVATAESGSALLRSLRGAPDELRHSLDAHADAAEGLSRLLDRHLDDEEDLIVPSILKYGEGRLA